MSWASHGRSKTLGVSSLPSGHPLAGIQESKAAGHMGVSVVAIFQRTVSSVIGHGGVMKEASSVEEFGSRCRK